jgi:DNA polymerase
MFAEPATKIDFFYDFETRSRLDLKTAGGVRYAMDPSTEATLLTWCFGRIGHVKEWRIGQPIPAEILDVAYNPNKYRMIAHNIAFDHLIWTLVFSRLIPNMVRPKIEDLEDGMAITTHFRVGGKLDTAAKILRMGYSKDPDGRRIMLKQCKPGRDGKFPVLTEEEWAKFSHYGKIDTKLLRDVYYSCPGLSRSERWAWEWTFKRNMRGIRLDLPLLNELASIVREWAPKLEKDFDECVSYQVKMNSPAKCKEYFQRWYPWIENMQADTVDKMLARSEGVPSHIRRAVEIKQMAGSTSIVKLKTALEQMHGGRIYNVLAYHFAQTKRWAGRGIQVQNFPRVDDFAPDKLDFNLDTLDLVSEIKRRRPYLKDPIGFVKNLLRRIFIADDGMEFLCGDFSKVEPSTLFWLLDMGPIPDKWYEETAAAIYSLPVSAVTKDSVERQVGKTAALSCGYGCGAENFQTQIEKQSGIKLTEDDAKKAVYGYRRANPKVVALWGQLEMAFRRAIHGEVTSVCNNRIHVMPMSAPHKGVQIRLPSGSYLYYHHAHIRHQQEQDKRSGQWIMREALAYEGDDKGVYGIKTVYGGLLTEHIVSATSRDIMVPAMWRLEQAGFDVLNTVHDEIWAQATPGRGDEFNKVMIVRPSWCDMNIGADFKNGARYLK